jgi:hypothetical protein
MMYFVVVDGREREDSYCELVGGRAMPADGQSTTPNVILFHSIDITRLARAIYLDVV